MYGGGSLQPVSSNDVDMANQIVQETDEKNQAVCGLEPSEAKPSELEGNQDDLQRTRSKYRGGEGQTSCVDSNNDQPAGDPSSHPDGDRGRAKDLEVLTNSCGMALCHKVFYR